MTIAKKHEYIESIATQSTVMQEIDIQSSNTPFSGKKLNPIEAMESSIHSVVKLIKNTLRSQTSAFCWYLTSKKTFRLHTVNSNIEHNISNQPIPYNKENILTKAVLAQKPLLCSYVNSKNTSSFMCYYTKPTTIRSFVSSPVICNGAVRALLFSDSESPNFFSKKHAMTIWQFSEICASIININLLRSEEQKAITLPKPIIKYVHSLYLNKRNTNSCLDNFVQGFKESNQFTTLTIALLTKKSELVIQRSLYYNGSNYLAKGSEISIESSATGNAFRTNTSGVIDNISVLNSLPRFFEGECAAFSDNGSLALVPITFESSPIGIIAVEHENEYHFKNEIFFKIRFFIETLSMALQSIHQETRNIDIKNENKKVTHEKESKSSIATIHFENRLETELNRAVREKVNITVAIVGIDGLSDIKEAYGKKSAINVYEKVGSLLKKETRSYDLYTEYSEDSFLLGLYHLNSSNMYMWGEKIKSHIARLQFPINKVDKFNITVSIGISSTQSNAQKNASTLIQEADMAVSFSREKGGNSIRIA